MNKKPKEPNRPYKPSSLKPPSKTKEVVQYLYDNEDIEISLQEMIGKIPNGISLDKVFIKSVHRGHEDSYSFSDNRCFEIYYLEDVENKDFDWEMEKYNEQLPLHKKNMDAYKQKIAEYKEKIKEYTKRLEVWRAQEKEREKERLKKRLADLEKE